jgi:hypothetical protein
VLAVSDFEHAPGRVQVTLLLAESAQVADGKLYILGGGIALVPAVAAPLAIAAKIDVPWDQADQLHSWALELLDADGMPVLANDLPILVQGQFQVSRTEASPPGSPLPMPLAVNFSGLGLPPGERFAWRLVIDSDTDPDWQVAFQVAETPVEPL